VRRLRDRRRGLTDRRRPPLRDRRLALPDRLRGLRERRLLRDRRPSTLRSLSLEDDLPLTGERDKVLLRGLLSLDPDLALAGDLDPRKHSVKSVKCSILKELKGDEFFFLLLLELKY
jgi:hypothetical protein